MAIAIRLCEIPQPIAMPVDLFDMAHAPPRRIRSTNAVDVAKGDAALTFRRVLVRGER